MSCLKKFFEGEVIQINYMEENKMNFFRRVYFFKDWHGERHFWTAKKLYKRVMIDADISNYNWIASATELVKVLKKSDFPECYAKEIKVAILKCFTYFENEGRWRARSLPTDDAAVHWCYNTLNSSEEDVVNAKKQYLKAIIRQSSLTPEYKYSFYIGGATYLKLQEEWRKKKLNKLVSKQEINFEQLPKDLSKDFIQTIKSAENNGLFSEDDEKRHQQIQELITSVIKSRDYYEL